MEFLFFSFFILISIAFIFIRAYSDSFYFGAAAGVFLILLGIVLAGGTPLEIVNCDPVVNMTCLEYNNCTIYFNDYLCNTREIYVSPLYRDGFGLLLILLGMGLCVDLFMNMKKNNG